MWQRLAGAAPVDIRPWLADIRPRATAPVANHGWQHPFNLIQARLRAAADGARHPRWDEQVHAWMLSLVEDCEAALGQLQAALDQEHARHSQLEANAVEAHMEVAKLRAELAGSRACESRARHQALHDSLTALPNRHHFRLSLAHAIDQASLAHGSSSDLAVCFVDLDGFKAINDEHGHAAGDELLGIVGKRLTRALRSCDVVGRMGGDEFACLLMGVGDRQHLCRLVHDVCEKVSAPIRLGGRLISVRPSIGVATFPDGGRSSDALLRSADQAMYQAKREQTFFAFFDGMPVSTP